MGGASPGAAYPYGYEGALGRHSPPLKTSLREASFPFSVKLLVDSLRSTRPYTRQTGSNKQYCWLGFGSTCRLSGPIPTIERRPAKATTDSCIGFLPRYDHSKRHGWPAGIRSRDIGIPSATRMGTSVPSRCGWDRRNDKEKTNKTIL